MGSKGRIQDKQTRMRLDRITHFGISCGDKINGVFNLEVEYIGKHSCYLNTRVIEHRCYKKIYFFRFRVRSDTQRRIRL